MFFSGLLKVLKQLLEAINANTAQQAANNKLLQKLLDLFTPPPPGPAVNGVLVLGKAVPQK